MCRTIVKHSSMCLPVEYDEDEGESDSIEGSTSNTITNNKTITTNTNKEVINTS